MLVRLRADRSGLHRFSCRTVIDVAGALIVLRVDAWEIPDLTRRPTNKPIDARRRYLDAGLRCIKRLGVAATRMDDIAEEAGVKRITLYRRFGSRTALLREIVSERYVSFHKRFAARVPLSSDLPLLVEEYLMFTIEEVLKDALTRDIVQGKLDFSSPGTPIHAAVRTFWEPLVAAARHSGTVDRSLDLDSIAQWILVCQFTFGRLELETPLNDEHARKLIRGFVTPAFGPRPTCRAGSARKPVAGSG